MGQRGFRRTRSHAFVAGTPHLDFDIPCTERARRTLDRLKRHRAFRQALHGPAVRAHKVWMNFVVVLFVCLDRLELETPEVIAQIAPPQEPYIREVCEVAIHRRAIEPGVFESLANVRMGQRTIRLEHALKNRRAGSRRT